MTALQAALAQPALPGGMADLRHVIFLMQENRSFDHYYGTLRGVRGFRDPSAIRLRTGRDVFDQPDRTGRTVLPFPVPNISAWRRTVAGDLTSAFDFGEVRQTPSSTRPQPTGTLVPRWKPRAPAVGARPVQEPGVRPARPVPYAAGATVEPLADGARIHLANAGSRSAHFTVFPYHAPDSIPLHADVLGVQELVVPAPGGWYDITVLGPTGERWDFVSGPPAGAE